ncbi:unnamed protein product, partial [marine sediment metagenome]
RDNNIPVIRNTMPHGAVGYHDSDEFGLYAAINNHAVTNRVFSSGGNGIRYFFKAITAALNFLDIDADCGGNNILVSDKKIGTITAYRFGGIILFHAHVLLNWDIDTAEKAIISPKHTLAFGIMEVKTACGEVKKRKSSTLRTVTVLPVKRFSL